MKTDKICCERCGEILKPNKVKWLELSVTDGNYYVDIPNNHQSQGTFAFGTTCATLAINDTINNLKSITTNNYQK